MATILDVARLAGVSQGTASNVLNRKGNVSSEKIRLVEEAAQKLGFSNSMSGSDILGINYSDWATIRSGSYFKLLNAYYGKGGQVSDSDDTTSSSTSTSKDSTRTLAVIESDAKSVEKSVAALQETGDKSLFNEVTKTDENGNKTTGYDTDAIYKAVKNFTDSYNSLIDEVGNSNTKSILRAGASMVNVTEANRKSLSDIGISIGADNKLTIDEEKFKKADMSKVKAMFADNSYYGTEVKRQAGRAESYAKSEAAKANTYQKSGSYTYNYRTGELYNSTI